MFNIFYYAETPSRDKATTVSKSVRELKEMTSKVNKHNTIKFPTLISC